VHAQIIARACSGNFPWRSWWRFRVLSQLRMKMPVPKVRVMKNELRAWVLQGRKQNASELKAKISEITPFGKARKMHNHPAETR
jgi:hypothetical protein